MDLMMLLYLLNKKCTLFGDVHRPGFVSPEFETFFSSLFSHFALCRSGGAKSLV